MVAVPVEREAALDVAPAELGDAAAVARLRHRVRLKQYGRAWLRLDVPPLNDGGAGPVDDSDASDILMPAIGETANRIRVVVEEDSARLAVWVERRDAWETVVAPVRLDAITSAAGEDADAADTDAASPWLVTGTRAAGAAGDAAGIWLEAGAPLRVARGPTRERRGVSLRDESIAGARGFVPAAFLGHVWIVPHDDRTPTEMTPCPLDVWEPPPDPRPQMELEPETAIRVAADEAAPVIATVQLGSRVAILERRAAWAHIELRQPYARIRGYVPESALGESGDFGILQGGCSGHGFGMSHADRIDVPAGTCLFDRANGDVAGVATETMTRLGSHARPGSAWSMVYVDTRWGLASLYVHDTGRDPAQPVLESCLASRHRR